MNHKSLLLILLTLALQCPLHVRADVNDSIVAAIKEDIKAAKEMQRIKKVELKEQEKAIRSLTKDLDRAKLIIQKNKDGARKAKAARKYFAPQKFQRTFIYNREPAVKDDAKAKEIKTEKAVKEKPLTVKTENGKPRKATAAEKDSIKAVQKAEAAKAKEEPKKEVAKVENAKTKEETKKDTIKEEKVPQKEPAKKEAAPTKPRKISDKEALRQQKERNSYYEKRLKEKNKQKAADSKAAKKAQKEEEKKRKEDEKARAKIDKAEEKSQEPTTSARRQRDKAEKKSKENNKQEKADDTESEYEETAE